MNLQETEVLPAGLETEPIRFHEEVTLKEGNTDA